MFEIQGKYGIIIDERAFNVALVHSQTLDVPKNINDNAFGTRDYLRDNSDFGFVWDIPIPNHVKYPIVGISFKYGVGYAQLSLKKDNKRTARVFIAIHKKEFLKHYPQYSHNKSHQDLLIDVCTKEPFKILFFDINPPVRHSGLGLEIFNKNGELIYDSDLPTLSFPHDLYNNADNYRTIIICKIFFPFSYFATTGSAQAPIRVALARKHSPLLFMGTRTQWASEAVHLLNKIDKNYLPYFPEHILNYLLRFEDLHEFNSCLLASY